MKKIQIHSLFHKHKFTGLALVGVVFTLCMSAVFAATSGPLSGGTFADDSGVGTIAWGTTGSANASDNAYALASPDDNQITHYLKATNFGFSVPAGATIDGITVEIEKSAGTASRIKDNRVRIIKGGSIGATDKSNASFWGTTDAYTTYGGVADLWGESWTVTDINSSNFGVAIAAFKDATAGNAIAANIDHIRITVSYTPSAAPTGTSAVVQNSTATTVDVVVTGTDFSTFVSSGTTTANSTDRANITYRSTNPTSAVINNATTMTLTFPIAMGTDMSGSLTLAAGTVQSAGLVSNALITIASGSITDTAKPVLTALAKSFVSGNNRLSFSYSEPVTVTNGANTTTKGDITTAGTVAGFGSFATAGNVTVPTTKNTVGGSGSSTITLDLADQTGGTLDGTSTTEPSGVFTPVGSAQVADAAANTVLTTATPTVTGGGTWDLTKPVFSSVAPTTSSTIDSITASSDVNYTLSEAITSGSITMTRTSGTLDGSSPHTCVLKGTALNTGAHTALDLSDTTNSCTVAQSLVTGSVYTFDFDGIDSAGNIAAQVSSSSVTFDDTVPTVTNVTSTALDGAYSSGLIPVTVTFSESVTVTGTPQLTLETGATDAVVDYTSGSPGTTLTFNYTISAGHTSADLDYTGTGALALNGGTIKDTATGVKNAALTLPAPAAVGSLGDNKDLVIDTTAPTLSSVTIASNNSDTAKAKVLDTVTLNFTSNEGVSTPTVTIGGSSATVGGGPTVWTASRAMTGSDSEGIIAFAIDFTDLAGNNGTQVTATTNSSSVTFDKTVPTVTEFTAVPTPSNDTTPSYTFDTDEAGTISYGGGCTSATTVAVALPSHNAITFGALTEGTYNCTVTVYDATGNAGILNMTTFEIDTTAPSVTTTSSTSDPTNVSPIPFKATFDEAVTDFSDTDITVGNGSVTSFTPDLVTLPVGSVYDFEVTPAGQGIVTVDIAGSVCTDLAGNNNTSATQVSRVFDNVNPTLNLTTGAPDPTNTSPIGVTATFSEAVNDFELGDIDVTNGAAGNLLGGPSVYTFDVTPAGEGNVNIDVDADVAQDDAGNGNEAANAAIDIEFDSDKPTVILSSTVTDPTNVSTIPVTATFSEDVTDFVDTDVVVGNGSLSNFAGGLDVYTFDVTPAGQGSVTVDVAADVAEDDASNTNFAAVQYATTYDSVAPEITSAQMLDSNSDGIADRVALTFDEAVEDTVSDSNGFDVTSTSDHGLCNSEMADPDGTTSVNVDFVCANIYTAVGDLVLNLSTNSGIVDEAGNQVATVSLHSGSVPPITDGVEPIVMSTTPVDGAVGVAFNNNVVVNFSEPMSTGSLVISDDDTNNYTGTVWSNLDKTVTLTHDDWTFDTFVTITVDASDLNAFSINGVGDSSFDFTTGNDLYMGQITVPTGLTVTDLGTDLSNGISTESGGDIMINGVTQGLNSVTDGDLVTVDMTVPQTIGDQLVTPLKAVTLNSTGTVILENSGLANVSVEIPNDTTLYGCDTWDGVLTLKSGNNSGNAPTGFSVGGTVYEVGSASCPLLLSQPATILITGLAGDATYKPAGSSNWYTISTCGGTFATPTAPAAPTPFTECSISNGTDTKIVTYHFTSFTTLTAVATSSGDTPKAAGGRSSEYSYENTQKQEIEAKKIVKAESACDRSKTKFPNYSDLSAGVESLYAENLYKKCAIDGYSKLYDDVSAKDPNAPYLLRAAKLGIIKGQSINSKKLSLLKPNDHIVKAEALQMILSAKGVDLEGYNKGAKFVDVASYDWFYKAVAFAKNESLVNTYEFIFPQKGQVSTLFKFPRLLSFKDTGKDVENLKSIMMQLDYYVGRINSTYDQELADAVKVYQKAKGITLSGNLDKDTRSKLLKEYLHPKTVYSFRPFDLITREEVARIVYLVDRLPVSLLKDNAGQVLGAQYSANASLIKVVKELFISTLIWLQ